MLGRLLGVTASREEFEGECLLDGFEPEHYRNVGRIGEGSFGVVSKMERVKSGGGGGGGKRNLPKMIALKNVPIKRLQGEDLREYKILKECDHPNILKLFYWQIVKVPNFDDFLRMYTELADANLATFLRGKDLSINNIKEISQQLIQGCGYLHSKQIVHRDIKPANILVFFNEGKDAVVKLGDFALARFMPASINSSFHYTVAGTRAYGSPETIRALNMGYMMEPKVPFATDIFSLGVVIYEMIVKKRPFDMETLMKPSYDARSLVKTSIRIPDIAEGLAKMLQWDPRMRPGAKMLLKYFTAGDKFTKLETEKMLEDFDPDDYVNVCRLGSGSRGVVYKFERAKSADKINLLPQAVAMKNVPIRRLTGEDSREYKILSECQHENILKMYYWSIVKVPNDCNHLHLYTELCEENLKTFLKKKMQSIDGYRRISKQLIEGCSYLHSIHVVHRNIKPTNILVNNIDDPGNIVVKLADFGFARFMPADVSSSFQYTAVGTMKYTSPEVTHAFLQCKMAEPKSSFATDIFSMGVVIYEMITNDLPFTIEELGRSSMDLETIVMKKVQEPKIAQALIKMMQWNPKMRPHAKELMLFFEI